MIMKSYKGLLFNILVFVSVGMIMFIAGCGEQNGSATSNDLPEQQGKEEAPQPITAPPETPTKAKEPVNLTMYIEGNNISDPDVLQFYTEPLKKKLPHITLDIIKQGKGNQIEDLLATHSFPDLIYTSNPGMPPFLNAKLPIDLNELIKKHNFDLNRFDQSGIEAIRLFGDTGQIYGVPFSTNMAVMIYNNDIFDKFGVVAPRDGMTWDDMIELGRDLTRKDGDVQYIGFDPGSVPNIASGLSLPYADGNTHKALFDSDGWRKVFAMVSKAYDVPGFVGSNGSIDFSFYNDRNVGMQPQWALQVLINVVKEENANLDWNLVQFPNFEGSVGKGREVDIHMLMISSLSKQVDEAFEVIKLVTSDEVQMDLSRSGKLSVLNNAEMINNYGSHVPALQGKNTAAIFKSTPSTPHVVSLYDSKLKTLVTNSRSQLAVDKKDLNTFVRDLQEAANQEIADMNLK